MADQQSIAAICGWDDKHLYSRKEGQEGFNLEY